MSDQETRRHDFSLGDVVYFVQERSRAWVPVVSEGGWDAIPSPKPILTAKKGVVEIINQPGFGGFYFPYVQIWEDPFSEPGFSWDSVNKNPRELFRPQEVQEMLEEQGHPLKDRPMDEVVADREVNPELATILGAAIMQRLLEDQLYGDHES